MDRIFVQMTAYQDRDCVSAIEDIYAQAADPRRVSVGICIAGDEASALQSTLPEFPPATQLQIDRLSTCTNLNISLMQSRAQQLYAGEAYVLAIDSRIRMAPEWDRRCVKLLETCRFEKAILSGEAADVAYRFAASFDLEPAEQIVFPKSGYVFSRASFLRDLAVDPNFVGEFADAAYAARIFTHGYSIFSPRQTLARRNSTRVLPEISAVALEQSKVRLMALFGDNLEGGASNAVGWTRLALGRERSMQVFDEFSKAQSEPRPTTSEEVGSIVTYVDAVLKKKKPVFEAIDQRRYDGASIVSDAPSGVFIMNDYLDADICRFLVAHADAQKSTPLGVGEYGRDRDRDASYKMDEKRVTEHVPIDGIVCEVLNIFNDVYCHRVAPYYGVAFNVYERPQILRYPVGGQFLAHADAEVWSEEQKAWTRVLYRDYSVLIYLNEDFEGGSLHFIGQNYTLQPKAGMLVAFPSDHRFLHEARPTTSGIRYAMVSWAMTMGSKPAKMPFQAAHISLMQPAIT